MFHQLVIKKLFFFIFLFGYCSVFSQTVNPEGVIEKYPDGTIKQVEYYSNGALNGESRYYYETGILKEIINYKSGRKDGNYSNYYETGILKESLNYNNNMLNGEYNTYLSFGYLERDWQI